MNVVFATLAVQTSNKY